MKCAVILAVLSTVVSTASAFSPYPIKQFSTKLLGHADNGSPLAMDRRAAFWAISLGAASIFVAPQMVKADGDENNTTLHILDYPKEGLCGQIQTTEKKAYFAKTFGGLKDGACSVEGYTKSEGTTNGINDKDKEKVYSLFGKE